MRSTSMTWDKSRGNRWRKWYKGVLYVVTCDELLAPHSKEASYREANAWWAMTRAMVDSRQPPPPHAAVIADLRRRRDWAAAHRPDLVPHLDTSIAEVAS